RAERRIAAGAVSAARGGGRLMRARLNLDAAGLTEQQWRERWAPARPVPSLGALRASPVIAVDVNASHLAVVIVSPDGNVTGTPFTIPLHLTGLPATARDGRVRAAITQLIAIAREHGAQAVAIENLDFAEARAEGRERTGSRPARGRRGRAFRRLIAGIPTGRFRDRLVQMTTNANLS